ncbi:MAG: homoserine O-succinyltransferase [Deltaproteobacteria bacterium]|nr:homoserine O-succinyltransferase [Deltaproteobacteria bacterium]
MVFIRLEDHVYSSSDLEHLSDLYVTFEEAVRQRYIDGLIVTGAPVEEMPYEEITYWREVQRVLRYARNNIPSTLGMCWGGLAIAKYLGIEKVVYPYKIFGVFRTKNLNANHRITGDLDDEFDCPQSRYSGLDDAVMEREQAAGNINLLAKAEKGGYLIFESGDGRLLAHLGYPEYEPSRLVMEFERDRKKGRMDVVRPEHFDLERPLNTWRSHRTEFFSQWIKLIHETRSY